MRGWCQGLCSGDKARDLPGFGYLKRSARTLDNFVEASGHVNILFILVGFAKIWPNCKPQTVCHVCGSSSTVSSVNVGYLQEGGENEKSDGALVLQTRCFSGVTVCQPDLRTACLRPSEEESESRSCRSFAMSSCGCLNVFLAILLCVI